MLAQVLLISVQIFLELGIERKITPWHFREKSFREKYINLGIILPANPRQAGIKESKFFSGGKKTTTSQAFFMNHYLELIQLFS